MTDEHSHEEPEPEPHMKFEDGKLWERDENGKWVDVTPEPKRTGDPELDTLWEMPADEVDRIAKDFLDPLHEKAKQVQAEAMEPIADAFFEASRPLRETMQKAFENIFPQLDFRSFGPLFTFKMPPQNHVGLKPWGSWHTEDVGTEEEPTAELDAEELEDAVDDVTADETGLEAVEPSDRFTFGTMQAAILRLLEHTVDGNETRELMRKESLEASKDASKWSRKANRKSVATITLSSVGIAIAVLSLLVSFFGWGIE